MKEVAKAQYVTDAQDKNFAVVCDLVKKVWRFQGWPLLKVQQPDESCCEECSVLPSRPSAENDYCVSYSSQKQSLGSNFCFQCWWHHGCNWWHIIRFVQDLLFCYCSLHPCGMTRIPNKIRIIWFLNLKFSYQEEQNAFAFYVSIPNHIRRWGLVSIRLLSFPLTWLKNTYKWSVLIYICHNNKYILYCVTIHI